ncbi:MAG: response regulator [Thermoproteota archaeon]
MAIISLITPKKVMVVDDEEDIVATIKMALQSQGYEAGCFTSPEMAIKEIRHRGEEYALVISDIRMPTITGFEFARAVRETSPDMPIVFMTAFKINKSEFLQVFPSTLVVELITKPFTTAQLIGTVRKYVGITEQH